MVTYDIKTKGNQINLSYSKFYLFIYLFYIIKGHDEGDSGLQSLSHLH